jgi:hypothetical protein
VNHLYDQKTSTLFTEQVELNLKIDSLRRDWGRHTNHAILRVMRFGTEKQINYGA